MTPSIDQHFAGLACFPCSVFEMENQISFVSINANSVYKKIAAVFFLRFSSPAAFAFAAEGG